MLFKLIFLRYCKIANWEIAIFMGLYDFLPKNISWTLKKSHYVSEGYARSLWLQKGHLKVTGKRKSTCEKLVSAWFLVWTSQGLNLRPPDYESERMQFYEIFFVWNLVDTQMFSKFAPSNEMLKYPVTRTDCFRIVFAKILRIDIRFESGGWRKLNRIEYDLSDFLAAGYGSAWLNVFAKTLMGIWQRNSQLR